MPRDQAKEEESTTSDGADPDAPQFPEIEMGRYCHPTEEARSVFMCSIYQNRLNGYRIHILC